MLSLLRKSSHLNCVPIGTFSFLNNFLPPDSKIRKFFYEFYHICKDGTKETYQDLKFIYSKRNLPSQSLSFIEIRALRLIKLDMLKLIPFTFFLTVPFSELLLPAYLLFFPNSIPSRYVKYFLKTRKKNFLDKKQERASIFLIESNIDLKNYKNHDSETLMKIADFLRMEYFSLTFFISQFVNLLIKTPFFIYNSVVLCIGIGKTFEMTHWLFDYRLKFNFFPLEFLKKVIILLQIRKHVKKLMKEDRRLLETDEESFKNIENNQIFNYLEERGFPLKDVSNIGDEIKKWRKKLIYEELENGGDYLIVLRENCKKCL